MKGHSQWWAGGREGGQRGDARQCPPPSLQSPTGLPISQPPHPPPEPVEPHRPALPGREDRMGGRWKILAQRFSEGPEV